MLTLKTQISGSLGKKWKDLTTLDLYGQRKLELTSH